MSTKLKPLDKFGAFVMHNLRDRALERHTLLQKGKLKAPAILELQSALAALPKDTRQLLLRCVVDSVDVAIHDFLFALQEAHDMEEGVEVLVDDTNIAGESDGLQGEPYGKRGWVATHSKYAKLRRDA